MADFYIAFCKTHDNEGGYKLHKVKGDAGGWTFAGIAYNYHPGWSGWKAVFAGDRSSRVKFLVAEFYRAQFWNRLSGDKIHSQHKANRIYDFAVNAGWQTAARYAQRCAGVKEDGRIGPVSIEAINGMSDRLFLALYKLLRVEHRLRSMERRTSQKKFIIGWLRRDLQGLKYLLNQSQQSINGGN